MISERLHLIKEVMALWCDKDRPRTFTSLRYNEDIASNLSNIVKVFFYTCLSFYCQVIYGVRCTLVEEW